MPPTIENSGALVPGAPLASKTRRVIVIRPFMYQGAPQPVNKGLALPLHFAAEMVSAGKAQYEAQAEAPPTKAAKAKE